MLLQVLGSSSKGNCYILRNENEVLIIEAGVKFKDVKLALDFDLSKIVGVISSHLHLDHSKYVNSFLSAGITVMAHKSVFDNQNIQSAFIKEIDHLKGYKIGGFKIFPMLVEHDVPCFSFIIMHEDIGKMLFVTDTRSFPQEYDVYLDYCQHFLIETNYSWDIIMDNYNKGTIGSYQLNRTPKTHLELNDAINILKRQNTKIIKDIILLHLSSKNSNSKEFCTTVQREIGAPTYAAKTGLIINL